eukprot:c2556_g1_i1.p1 GENE.c2556_g1_i1~~c2556_g1_i1.p1  ORF type:complete len:204 (+),score=53.43 c2556_g1_i1:29-613(+)
MAAAVEGAKVVVVAMSGSYQMSANCRLEAEFALTLHKPIVPLMMESQWRPTGWLGLLLGAKLYIDLSKPSALTAGGKARELIKEVSQHYHPHKHVSKPVSTGGSGEGVAPTHEIVKNARTMSVDEVGKLLQENGLNQYQNTFRDLGIDGEVLFALSRMGHTHETADHLNTVFGVAKPTHTLKMMRMISDIFSLN